MCHYVEICFYSRLPLPGPRSIPRHGDVDHVREVSEIIALEDGLALVGNSY